MASQSARRIIREEAPVAGAALVEFELACGCVVKRALDVNRLFTTDDGARIVAGKYPCPLDHPVKRPA